MAQGLQSVLVRRSKSGCMAAVTLALVLCLPAKPLHAAAKEEAVSAAKPGASKRRVASARVLRQHRVKTSSGQSRNAAAPVRLSYGQLAGLDKTPDPLQLKSSVALVVDQSTNEVLLGKNEEAVLPIASLTKLMTGLVISEANLPMEEQITVTQDDVDTEKGSRSRLHVGAQLSRGELMHLALMSSENRAAHALGRTYPGGLEQFVDQMNSKARELGMEHTHYVEPTGLSSQNQSSAQDLVKLVDVASGQALLRALTTSPQAQVALGRQKLQYNNTNRLVKNRNWDIGLQKTGYISEAGQCLVMQANVAGRQLIMVFLDSVGKLSRFADAERVRRWLETSGRAATVLSRSIDSVQGS